MLFLFVAGVWGGVVRDKLINEEIQQTLGTHSEDTQEQDQGTRNMSTTGGRGSRKMFEKQGLVQVLDKSLVGKKKALTADDKKNMNPTLYQALTKTTGIWKNGSLQEGQVEHCERISSRDGSNDWDTGAYQMLRSYMKEGCPKFHKLEEKKILTNTGVFQFIISECKVSKDRSKCVKGESSTYKVQCPKIGDCEVISEREGV